MRIEELHERSGVGNLVRPSDLLNSPDDWWESLKERAGAEIEHLGITQFGDDSVSFHSQPTPRFHGSVAGMLEEVPKQFSAGRRVLVAVPNIGEVERLADAFSESGVSYRLGSRTVSAELTQMKQLTSQVKC